MAKVDQKYVLELFAVLSFQLDGINETIRCGDDGWQDSITTQVRETKTKLNEFLSLHFAEKIPDTPDKYYVKAAEALLDIPPDSLSQRDRILLFMAKLYAYLKRCLRDDKTDLSAMDAMSLSAYIECYLQDDNGVILRKVFYNHWIHSGTQVIDDIVNEIMLQRQANPQVKLFG